MNPSDLSDLLLVLAAGLGAGVLITTIGVASLVSFPVLVAVGLPPVAANASNTIGLVPAGLSGSFGYRAELKVNPAATVRVLVVSAVGAVGGASLLLLLPPGVFEAVVPWLILFTCLLVGVQPWLAGWLRRRQGEGASPREEIGPVTTFFATLTGVYGGYFGAGSGVMMVAVLGLGTDLELRVVNGLKTLAILAGNVVATVIFLFFAELDWRAIGLLSAGSVGGGYLGARIGRRLPPTVFRVLVVLGGVTAGVLLM